MSDSDTRTGPAADEDLRVREARLERAQSIAHLGSWQWDLVSDEVSWSDELYRIFGVNPQTFIPSNEAARELIHPDDRDQHLRYVQQVLGGTPVPPFESRIIRPSGEERVVLASGFDLDRDASGAVKTLFGAILDITDRKRMEAALRLALEEQARVEATGRAKNAFLASLGFLHKLDDERAVVHEATRMLCEFVGAQSVAYVEDPDDEQAKRASVRVPVRDTQGKSVLLVRGPDGRDWTAGELALFDEVAQRIHTEVERSRAQALTQSTKTVLKAALAAMTDAVHISDVQGQFVTFNDAFASFHRLRSTAECPKALAQWTEILEVSHPDGRIATLDQWPVPRALRGESGSSVEYQLRRRDTEECWTGSYSFAPIRDQLGQIIGSVVVGRDVTAVKRMHDDLATAHADLQRLVAGQDTVQEQERLRIARELHDEMLQNLAGILLETARVRVATGPRLDPHADHALSRIDHIAAQVIKSTRRIIQDLRPQALDELGLVAALSELATQFSERTGVACTLNAASVDEAREARLGPLSSGLYRIAQEALNNVAKHAHAKHVRMQLVDTLKGGVRLTVQDDGQGISLDANRRRDAFGLPGMRERARAAGGSLSIVSKPGEGTTVTAEMPVDAASQT